MLICTLVAHVGFSPQRLPALLAGAQSARCTVVCAEDTSASLVEQLVDGVADVGPGLFKTDPSIADSDVGPALAALRIASGVLMIHHVCERLIA